MNTTLPHYRSAIVVVAHPDDESFGLGAILAHMIQAGTEITILCFTHGEASTIGADHSHLATTRAHEYHSAAAILGVSCAEMRDYADGRLSEIAVSDLAAEIGEIANSPDVVLVFDEGGLTGHPDHKQATKAAIAWAAEAQVAVLAWAIPTAVAQALNSEFGTEFAGRGEQELDFNIRVDRSIQLEAISCHASQATDNPVLRRRLQLQGDQEVLYSPR